MSNHLIRYAGDFFPYVIEEAKGTVLITSEGKKILDFTSGQMCATLGHSHPEIVSAIEKAAQKNIHLFSLMLSPAVLELAERFSELLPKRLSKIIFLSTGSESNEAAIRMAKLCSGKFEIIALTNSWHGMTAGAWSTTYAAGHKNYGPTMVGSMVLPAPYCYRCPLKKCPETCQYECIDLGFSVIDASSVGSIAAVIVEPILSSGGVITPPKGYFKRIQEECRRRGAYLIFDEAQTALGRLGSNFAFEIYDVVPDFLTVSKTLGGGIPLAATCTSEQIEQSCFDKGFLYYTSHVSDPLPAEVGIAVLRQLATNQLKDNAKTMGIYLMDLLNDLAEKYECVGDVRGMGLLVGVEFVEDRVTKRPWPELGQAVTRECLKLGLHLNIVNVPKLSSVIRIAPPLTVSKLEIDRAIGILDCALGKVTSIRSKKVERT